MEKITSRKNSFIKYLATYKGSGFLCCGEKMLQEAIAAECEIECVLWIEGSERIDVECSRQYECPKNLFDYVNFQDNSRGPLFIAHKKEISDDIKPQKAIILENVQDPGNVGTVLRTANAMNIDCVYLIGDCASLHNPKTVRASMGAIFRQRVKVNEFPDLPIYGAVLADDALLLNDITLNNCAVAIGNEGKGLTEELISKCIKKVIIPMSKYAESLNAAVAASIFMWEMSK